MVAVQPPVAALAEQVGADGDRHQPQRHRVGEVAAVDAGGEGDREAVAEDPPEPPHQVDGEDVQRLAREVDLLDAGGEEAARVLDDHGVRELDPEAEAELGGGLAQPADHLHRLLPGGVAREGAVGHPEVVVAELVVEQPARLLRPQQHRVELDDGVQPQLAHQELDDLLDLVRRAAVEGRQRHAVRELRRVVEVAQPGEAVGDLAAEALDGL